MDLAELVVDAAAVELRVDEYIQNDDFSTDYRGPELVAVALTGHATMLTAHGRRSVPLGRDNKLALLEAALAARDEQHHAGSDTATRRPFTRLTLAIDHARPAQRFVTSVSINHWAPHVLPPAWTAVLRALRAPHGVLPAPDSLAWTRALRWTAPVELGELFAAGEPVPVPLQVTPIEHAGGLYLRTGQRPGRSLLYRLDVAPDWRSPEAQQHALRARVAPYARMVCLDDDRQLEPDRELAAMHAQFNASAMNVWTLPCGGGRVHLRQRWGEAPVIVIERLDDRGIWIQRG